MKQKKTIVCVFAHPDDESFGPGGTIATLVQEHDVYIICVTNGDAGQADTVSAEELGEIRKKELLASSKILGVKKVFFLGYHDGTLSNTIYHEIARKVEKIITELRPEILLTFENRGVSGHLDHIAVSMITSYVFERTPFIHEMWYYVNLNTNRVGDYFIYIPKGYNREEVDMVVDTSAVWEKKLEAVKQHVSQSNDVARIMKRMETMPKEEYFLVIKKQNTL